MLGAARVQQLGVSLLRYRWLWSVVPMILGTAVQALASTGGAPWGAHAATWYDGVVGSYVPYASGAAIIGSVIAYRHLSEHEGLMLKFLTWGVIIAVASGALAYSAFWGAPVTHGMTLDELNISTTPEVDW